ncbi:MAG: hypothetical protein VCA74_00540, partial [Deltaproteobacteria bacterium]
MSSYKSVLGLCIAVFAFVVVPALPADAGFSKTELKCRSTIAKGGGKLAATVSKTLGKCHKLQAKGKVLASVDCNSIAGADTKGKVAK